MIHWLTTSSIQARFFVVAAAAALLIIGVAQLRNAPLGVYPEFSPVYVEIQTEAAGLSADEVEQLLTVSIEQDLLNGIAFLDEIWSQSMQGLSRVVCIFEPGTDPMKARQVVAERMTQAHALPNVSKPPIMLQPYSSTSRIMKVGLSSSSEDLNLIDLSVLARWNIQPYLMGIEGVANVSIWGQRKRQLQVQVDPEILRDNGVTLNEVVKTTGEAIWVSPLSFLHSSTPGTGGFFDTPNQRLGIRHVLPISEAKDLANISVHGHKDMLLGDVTSVVEDHQPLIGDAIINGNPGLLLVIEKFPWANTVEVSEKIEKALEELRPGLSGVVLDTAVYQPARYAEASMDNLKKAAGLGLVALLVLIFFFFLDWRTALIASFSIVLASVTGAYVLYLNGVMMNMMVLAGLAVALVIIFDDVLVTVENIRRRLGQAQTNVDPHKSNASIILEATLEMRSSVLFATLILLLVLLPVLALGGRTGAFVMPFASSYVVALLTSLIVALTVTPAMSVLLFSKSKIQYQENGLIVGLRKLLNPAIIGFAKAPIIAYALLGIILVAGLVIYPTLDKSTAPPALQERDLLIEWKGTQGTSNGEMNRLTMQVIKELDMVDGVKNIVGQTGRAVMSDKVSNMNNGEIWVSIDDDADYDRTLATIQKIVSGYPGLNEQVTNYHLQSVNKSVAITNPLYAVRVYGEDQETLQSKTEEVQKEIAKINGIENTKVDYPFEEPTIEIEVDMDAARKHEIQPGKVRRTAAIMLAGVEAGSLFEGQKVFDVVVWGTPKNRNSISSVENLLINKPDGGHVRLGDVAHVRVKRNLSVINRESVSRYMDVSFDLGAADIGVVSADIDKSLAAIDFPLEFHAELVGEYERIDAEKSKAISYLIAALLGIFLLLQAAFWSWRLSLAVFFSLAMALAGGLIVCFLNGGVLSLGSMVGFLAILGIAVHQAVVLIRHLKKLEMDGVESFGIALVLRGIQERFAPMMMSTLMTAFVFIPFALFGNMPGLEILSPMSLTILGGLFTTTLLNLLVIPSIYLAFGRTTEEVKEEEKAMLDIFRPVNKKPSIQLQN